MRGKWLVLINKTVFAILTVIILLISATSCEGGGRELFGYMNEPFFMEIDGDIDGISICAGAFCDPTEHLTKEIYEKMIISFSAPESLCGMNVTYLSDGKSILRMGEIVSEESVSKNISLLFSIFSPSQDMTRIRKESGGYTVAEYESEDGIVSYIFDEDGELFEISGRKSDTFFHFNVKIEPFEK